MTEIKRYEGVLVDGVSAHRPSVSGRWVKHDDLAAIVAEKDARIAELEYSKRSVTENYLRVTAERNEALYKVIELQEQLRALVVDGAIMHAAIDQTIGWQQSVDAGNTESVRCLVAIQGKTPRIDTALREIRAQAVDSFSEDCKVKSSK